MTFIIEQEKSMKMIEGDNQQNVHRNIGGVALSGFQSDQYLRVGLKARGPTPEAVLSRVNKASADARDSQAH